MIVRYANPVMALNYTCLTEAYSPTVTNVSRRNGSEFR